MSVFSPLAFDADPAVPATRPKETSTTKWHARRTPTLFAKVLAEPATKVILVKDGKVAVPHGQGAIADYAT